MVAALAADLVLRYTEYTTMLAKKEDIEGVGESGGLFSDYHISMWQVTNCHLEEWLDLTDDERAAVLSDHSRVARDLLVDLQRLAPEIDVAIVMPWHRANNVYRDRISSHWQAWIGALDEELQQLEPSDLAEPNDAIVSWWDAVQSPDRTAIEAAFRAADSASSSALPPLHLFGVEARRQGIFTDDTVLYACQEDER